jgi:hypothetical protein
MDVMRVAAIPFRNEIHPVLIDFAEEDRYQPPAMDLEPPQLYKLEEDKWFPLLSEKEIPPSLHFSGFLDGVQRTVLVGILRAQNGANVPLYLARVAAGLLIREGTELRMGPVRAWNVIVAPFRTVKEEPEELVESLRQQGWPAWTGREAFGTGREPRILRELLGPESPWILADTSVMGISEDPKHHLISSDDLWRERQIRARAQGRIAHLRQVLELLLLLAVRFPELGLLGNEETPAPETPILVDGPLLLSTRRRRWLPLFLDRMGKRIGEEELEQLMLKNAVGLVKSHRLNPPDPAVVLGLPEGYRSAFFAFEQEVDIHGRNLREDMEAEEDHLYPRWHITAYVRLRRRPDSDLAGLVRIDMLRPEPERGPGPLSPEEEEELSRRAASVYRERRPWLPGDRDQPFPITLLEKALHARLPPPVVLANMLKLEHKISS